MATATFTEVTADASGNYLWSESDNWSGGLGASGAPTDGDDIIITAGDTVTYDDDNSADATGYAGIELRGTFQVLDDGGNYILKVAEYSTENACIVCDQRGASGGTVGRFLVGTALDNGLSSATTFKIQANLNDSSSQVFKQTEDPSTNGNWLEVKIFDQYGHIQRHAEITGWDNGTNTVTCNYNITQVSSGDDLPVIATRGAKSWTTLSGSVVDNGDGTYDYTLAGMTATTEGQFNNGANSPVTTGRKPHIMFAESNVEIEHIGSSGSMWVTGSCSHGIYCCKYTKFHRLNQSGTGTHSYGNKWYGVSYQIQGLLDQGSYNQICGAFMLASSTWGEDTQGGDLTSNFKGHMIGLDSNSFVAGGTDIIPVITADSGAGTLALRGNIGMFQLASAGKSTARCFLELVDLTLFSLGWNDTTYNGHAKPLCYGIVPSQVKNLTMVASAPLIEPGATDEIYAANRLYFEDCTFSDYKSTASGTYFDMSDLGLDSSSFIQSDIVFKNLSLDGTTHDYYLEMPGEFGVVTTETSGIPAGGPSEAFKLDMESGRHPMYVERHIHCEVGDSLSVSAQAYLVDAMDVAPVIKIEHETAWGFNSIPTRDIDNDSNVLASSAFHDGGTGDWQSGSLSHTTTRSGIYIVTMIVWGDNQGDVYATNKTVWATLTATASSGGGGSTRIIDHNIIG